LGETAVLRLPSDKVYVLAQGQFADSFSGVAARTGIEHLMRERDIPCSSAQTQTTRQTHTRKTDMQTRSSIAISFA
jgi:hypothetical protein